ncbi:MAG: AraC family transcriptional regulator [Burkholderiales bacterium]|nr:AraC family transcriptional regulator [Burkholderiales bacterium]
MHSIGRTMAAGATAAPAPAPAAEAVKAAPTLVFRAVLSGAASLAWGNRRVRLDEDAWLVLDGRESCSVRLDPELRTRMFVVVVAPDEFEAATAGVSPADFALADNLRSRDGPAGHRLAAIAQGRDAGRGEAEEREQRIALVRDAWAEEQDLRRKAARIDCVKRATREQLLRRILLAADFIASHHEEPISLDEMARAASLSRFHFVRLFSLVHGETPHAFLRRKRTAVARRHLADGSACSEAASRAGFGSRSSLFRNLRKSTPAGAGPESCFHSA